jgi:formylglycine-generating enzyme required for sulfatase activity
MADDAAIQANLALLKQLHEQGVLDDEQYRAQRAALIGAGAVAQGDNATALGARAVQVTGDVGRDVITGRVTVNELPAEVLALFARQFGFDPGASDAEALQSYVRHVIFERHSFLSFQFIEPRTGKVYTEADIEDVFVALRLTNPEGVRRAGRETFGLRLHSSHPEGAEEDVLLTLPDVLRRYDCFLLRGKPGSGKTTLLRHIALAFVRGEQVEKLDWEGRVPLPLLIPLRNFGAFLQRRNRAGTYLGPQPRTLLEYLEEEVLRGADVRFSPRFLPERLEAGQCFLLLDALDEVSGTLDDGGDLRAAVARQVAAFIRHYRPKGNRFALTSRPRAYREDGAMRRALPQPHVCDVLDLDHNGYRQLIHNVLAVLTRRPGKSAVEAADLIRCVATNRQLTELVGNPLLCTTLVLVYKYYGRRLPERRVDVLDEVVTLLLGRWEEARTYLFSPDKLVKAGTTARTTERAIEFRRRALVTVAWEMQTAQQAEIAGREAVAVLADFYCQEERVTEHEAQGWAEAFLDVAHERSGLFIAVDEGVHAFAHQAFREYFAATHLVSAGEARLVAEVLRHAPEPDEWWRQVLLLAGAHPQLSPGAAGRLIERLMQVGDLAHVALAARFAQDMTDKLPGPQRKVLQDWLLALMRDPARPAQARVHAGRALARAGDPRRGVGVREDGVPDIAWVMIPAGPFLMGSTDADEKAYDDEKPQHTCEIAVGYGIGRYPVTVAQYAAFVRAGGYGERRYWTAAGWQRQEQEGWAGPATYGTPFELSNHPVVGVSWYEAVAYCAWLTERLRAAGELDAQQVVRLPSEPEWEKAARGTEGRIYPWGDASDPERANYNATGIGSTSAVGCFPGGESPYGVEEMVGNVWEWCGTKWVGTYREYQVDDEVEGDALRVVRGGSFGSDEGGARCAYRFRLLPSNRNRFGGFRVVVSPSRPGLFGAGRSDL